MAWNDWVTRKEEAVLKKRSVTYSDFKADQRGAKEYGAILIVYNVNQFRNLFFDTDNMTKAGGEFGGTFDHLYVVPLSHDGGKHLKWLMTTDDNEMNADIINDAIQSGSFRRSIFVAPHVFLLQDTFGRRTALGFQLDSKLMTQIYSIATSVPDENFAVLCYEWQEPYYRVVMPENVEIITLEMS